MPLNNDKLFLIGIAVLCVFVTIIIVVCRCNRNICSNTCSTIMYPSVMDPSVIDPSVIDPSVMDPSVMDPSVIDPSVMDPSVIDPSVMDPNLPLQARRRSGPVRVGRPTNTPTKQSMIQKPFSNKSFILDSWKHMYKILFAKDSFDNNQYFQLIDMLSSITNTDFKNFLSSVLGLILKKFREKNTNSLHFSVIMTVLRDILYGGAFISNLNNPDLRKILELQDFAKSMMTSIRPLEAMQIATRERDTKKIYLVKAIMNETNQNNNRNNNNYINLDMATINRMIFYIVVRNYVVK